MGQGTGGHDTWWRRHFGMGAWADTTPAQRIGWAVVGGAGSAMLLAAFWLVLNQSLARAEQHWERAARSPGPDASSCLPGRPMGATGDGCPAMVADSVGRHATGSGARLGTGPR